MHFQANTPLLLVDRFENQQTSMRQRSLTLWQYIDLAFQMCYLCIALLKRGRLEGVKLWLNVHCCARCCFLLYGCSWAGRTPVRCKPLKWHQMTKILGAPFTELGSLDAQSQCRGCNKKQGLKIQAFTQSSLIRENHGFSGKSTIDIHWSCSHLKRLQDFPLPCLITKGCIYIYIM